MHQRRVLEAALMLNLRKRAKLAQRSLVVSHVS